MAVLILKKMGGVKIHHRLHGLTQNELNLLIIKDAYLRKSV